MKKTLLILCIFTLIVSIPVSANAMDISDTIKRYIKTAYQKFDGINVTGGIKNSKGRVTIKDSMKVNKVAILNGNLNVKGEIKNNLSGIPVKINDDMRVYGVAKFKEKLELGQIDFSVTDISSIDTSTLSGGDVFLNSADYKLYLWNGSSWVDLTQQNTDTTYTAGANVAISGNNEISATNTTYSNGTGIDLAGTAFSVDQGFSPTWTGNHTFEENVALERTEPSLLLNATRSSDIDFSIKNDTQISQQYNELTLGQGAITSNSEKLLTFNPQYKMTQNWNNSLITAGGSDVVIGSLAIAVTGCDTPNQVTFVGADLSNVTPYDTFVDEVGARFNILSVNDVSDQLGFSGSCTYNGDADAFVTRDNLITYGGNVGINMNPGFMRPAADLHINDTLMLEPTDTPGPCDALHEGSIYANDTLGLTCYCDGTGTDWVRMDDFVSTCP